MQDAVTALGQGRRRFISRPQSGEEPTGVADAVMQMPEPVSNEELQIQRACTGCEDNELQKQQVEEEEEEEKLQTKPIAEQITPLVQRQIEPEE